MFKDPIVKEHPLFSLWFNANTFALMQITFEDNALYEHFKNYLNYSIVEGVNYEGFNYRETLAHCLSVGCYDNLGSVGFKIDGVILAEVTVCKFLLETNLLWLNLDGPSILRNLYPSPSEELILLLEQVAASKGKPTITLNGVTVMIPVDLLAIINRYSPQQEINTFTDPSSQGCGAKTESHDRFFTQPQNSLNVFPQYPELHPSTDQARGASTFRLQNAEDRDKNSHFFTYNKENIFISEATKRIVIKIVPTEDTEDFQNWFKYLPLKQRLKFGVYEVCKLKHNKVAINKGKTCRFEVKGIQIEPEAWLFLVRNNFDTVLNGHDAKEQREKNLLHSLEILSKILVQNCANNKLIEAAIDNDFNKVQRELINGADPDAPLSLDPKLSLRDPTLSLKYPTLLHYICLMDRRLIQNYTCRRIALELIYWGAKTAKDVASDLTNQVNTVLDIVWQTTEKASITYGNELEYLRSVFIRSLMDNYMKSGSWLSPSPHQDEAKLIAVGSLDDIITITQRCHMSPKIDRTGTFYALLDFILDTVKLYSALYAHAKAHRKDAGLPLPEVLLTKEGIGPLPENCITEGQDEENKSEMNLLESFLISLK